MHDQIKDNYISPDHYGESGSSLAGRIVLPRFPIIDVRATGENIRRLRKEKKLSIRDMAAYFGFNNVQTIYKWQNGSSLPTVENLFALSRLLEVPIEQLLAECNDSAVSSVSGSMQSLPAEQNRCYDISAQALCTENTDDAASNIREAPYGLYLYLHYGCIFYLCPEDVDTL